MNRWLFYYIDDVSGQLTGGGRSVRSLVLGLRERNAIDPVFVSQCRGTLTRDLEEEGLPVQVVPLPERLDVYDGAALEYSIREKAQAARALLRYNQKIRGVIRDHEIEGVWTRRTRGVLQVGIASWLEQCPLVWDIGVEKQPKGLVWMLQILSLLLADKVVTQAKVQPRLVFGRTLSSLLPSKFRAIYPGIAPDRAAQLREAAVQSGDKSTNLVSIGSIHPRKNQEMLLRAFAEVHQEHPDAVLDLVGPEKDEAYAECLRRFVGSSGLSDAVRFHGWRDDVPDLLGRSDLLVLSSHREGVPHVIREAMFAEVPVVATAVGGVLEAVEDGKTGFLVPDDGVDEMRDRISDLLSHPEERKAMGKRGYKLAQRRFSREAWLSEYADLLQGLSR
jgi:glycosyltransferase involved in cell wall biosynthesis